jgi:hypothetical protein
VNDFLNAKSMITPGVAGGLVMLISNTCAAQFNLAAKWTALVLSALLALFVVYILIAPFWQKGLLWIFNGLVIFSMAMGANQAGATISSQTDTKLVSGPYPTPQPSASPVSRPSPSLSGSPAPTPHKIDPKLLNPMMKQESSFFHSWLTH